MAILQSANLALSFIIELFALAAFGYWGAHTGQTVLAKIGLGGGAAGWMVVVWGAFLAPQAARPLPDPWHALAEIVVFAVAAIALYAAGQHSLALIFAVVIAINQILVFVWKQ